MLILINRLRLNEKALNTTIQEVRNKNMALEEDIKNLNVEVAKIKPKEVKEFNIILGNMYIRTGKTELIS